MISAETERAVRQQALLDAEYGDDTLVAFVAEFDAMRAELAELKTCQPPEGAAAMSKPELEQSLVFAFVPIDDEFYCLIGIPAACWDYIKDGKTNTLDLEAATGIPLKLIVYGAEDHDTAVAVIHAHNARLGLATLDMRREDYSVKPAEELPLTAAEMREACKREGLALLREYCDRAKIPGGLVFEFAQRIDALPITAKTEPENPEVDHANT